MTKRHIKLAEFSPQECRDYIVENFKWQDRYQGALSRIEGEYDRACRRNLRIDRATWIVRDDRLGELSRPVSLAEWPACTLDDAMDELFRAVWCNAVREHNRALAA